MNSKERARQRAEARTQTVWYKLKEGENGFRLLPTPASKTTQDNFYEYGLHREVGPKKQTLRCGKDPESGEGSCWLCDSYITKLRKKGQDVRASALAAKDAFLVQIASVDGEGKMKGPLLFNPSKTVSDQLLILFGSKKKTYEDPVKGYSLTLSRTGTGKNDTRYGIIEPDEEPSKVPSSIMSVLKPFSDLQEIPTYSEAKQKAAIQGIDAIEDDDDDDDVDEEEQVAVDEDEDDEDEIEEVAPKKKAAVAAKKKVAPEPEEEEEDDEEEDEPEPIKAKPPVKGKVAAKKVVEVEEDEDEEVVLPPKKAAKKKVVVEEEDEELELDDEDLELDEEDLEEEIVPIKKVAKKK